MRKIPRMTPDELRGEREALGMTGAEFGEMLGRLIGLDARTDQNGDDLPAGYSKQEINAWETGRRPVPADVERVLLRLRLEAMQPARSKRAASGR